MKWLPHAFKLVAARIQTSCPGFLHRKSLAKSPQKVPGQEKIPVRYLSCGSQP